jgi:hypothetical protein
MAKVKLRQRFQGYFLKDPTPAVQTPNHAFEHICRDEWFTTIPRRFHGLNDDRIRKLLVRAQLRAEAQLDSGRWKADFPGKEIFHHIGSMIFRPIKNAAYQPTSAELHTDLAKEVGAWQRENNRIHPSLIELREALRLRISRRPPPAATSVPG